MNGEFWINSFSKDLIKSKDFFNKIGFTLNAKHSTNEMLSMFIGSKNIVFNLFPESMFKSFVDTNLCDTKSTSEVLFSIGANSIQEVDDWAQKVKSAGGQLFGGPGFKEGWMYGFGFVDIDGHRWNILYMDISKMPK